MANAESRLLGTLLEHPALLPAARKKLTKAAFSSAEGSHLWVALCDLHDRGLRFTSENLSRYSGVDPVLALGWRGEAIEALPPSVAEVSLWAEEIASAAERRRVEALLVEASRKLDRGSDVASWLADELLALRRGGAVEESFGEALESALEEVLERPYGLSTGLGELDLMLNGLVAGNLIVIGGRPGDGKTSLALGTATHQALQGVPVVLFSLEMTRAELALRQACCLADISAKALRSCELDEEDWKRLERAAKRIATLPLRVDDTGALSVGELVSRARSLEAKVVYVDYAQLLSAEGFRRDDARGSMTHISKSLKGLAKASKVPVVLLSQLSRPEKGARDAKPTMFDLKESSGLEQDADAVLLIWRPEEMRDAGRAQVLVAKNRHGAIGDVTLGFVGDTTSFVNLEVA